MNTRLKVSTLMNQTSWKNQKRSFDKKKFRAEMRIKIKSIWILKIGGVPLIERLANIEIFQNLKKNINQPKGCIGLICGNVADKIEIEIIK